MNSSSGETNRKLEERKIIHFFFLHPKKIDFLSKDNFFLPVEPQRNCDISIHSQCLDYKC